MKKTKFVFMIAVVLLLIPTVSVFGDTGSGATNWGGWRKTQKAYQGGLEHSTDVQCVDNSGNCRAGSRTITENAGLPDYKVTTTTKWTYGFLRIAVGQSHEHQYYGDWISK